MERIELPWRRHRLAVVLSGGGMMGAFQAGVIDVMARRGVRPEVIVGTSIGSLNGAFWAFNPNEHVGDQLQKIWRRWPREVMPARRLAMLRQIVAWPGHLLGNNGLMRMIEQELGADARVDGSAVKLIVVAADATTGERRLLRDGPLLPALLASTAVPGVFPPVEIGGKLLIDGGVVANADIDAAVESDATDILAVDLAGPTSQRGRNDLPSLLEQAVSLSLATQTNLRMRSIGKRARVALLRPLLERRPTLTDMHMSMLERLFVLGQVAAGEFLDRHLSGTGRVRPGSYIFTEAEAQLAPAVNPKLSAQPAAGA